MKVEQDNFVEIAVAKAKLKYNKKFPDGMKMCSLCKKMLPLYDGNFYLDKYNIHFSSKCIPCYKLYRRELSSEVKVEYRKRAEQSRRERMLASVDIEITTWEDDAVKFIKRLIKTDFVIYHKYNILPVINDIITFWMMVEVRSTKYDQFKMSKQINLMVNDLVEWYTLMEQKKEG